MMLRFGARIAFALHFHKIGKVVPPGGGAFVHWHTNERLAKGDFPHDFQEFLPPQKTLGTARNNLAGQFEFASNVATDADMTVHMATFRLSFAIQAWVTDEIANFDKVKQWPDRIFRPGFLKV